MKLFSRNEMKERTPMMDKVFKARKKARKVARASRKSNR